MVPTVGEGWAEEPGDGQRANDGEMGKGWRTTLGETNTDSSGAAGSHNWLRLPFKNESSDSLSPLRRRPCSSQGEGAASA